MWESPVSEFEGLDMSELDTDEAYLRVRPGTGGWLYHINSDCDKCPWQLLDSINNSPFKIKTHHVNSFMIRRDNSSR